MGECDQAVMDFLATTQVGKFPPKCICSGMDRTQGLGLRSLIGGNGVVPFSFFLSFFLPFLLSLFPLSSFICQRGRKVVEGELRPLASSPGGGGDHLGPAIL